MDSTFITGIDSSPIVMESSEALNKTQEQHMGNYLSSLKAIEDCIEPFKDQKRALKENYIENGWLDKKEISLVTKAYRLVKNNLEDLDELLLLIEALRD